MISVLTLTYKRHHLLEEAIESFLRQTSSFECEMVVVNDNPEVDYVFSHPLVNIINHKERFPSISSKIEWGYKQCKYNHIYRLDDDDLLAPSAIYDSCIDILNNPGYDIYRSNGHYFFLNNIYKNVSDNINNGNIYDREYLDRITFPDKSGDEDADITFNHNAKIFTSKEPPTMIYRWGMATMHISGLGKQTNEKILSETDRLLRNEKGTIVLSPHFNVDYYSQLEGM